MIFHCLLCEGKATYFLRTYPPKKKKKKTNKRKTNKKNIVIIKKRIIKIAPPCFLNSYFFSGGRFVVHRSVENNRNWTNDNITKGNTLYQKIFQRASIKMRPCTIERTVNIKSTWTVLNVHFLLKKCVKKKKYLTLLDRR